jgi:3-phosphoshikimate 1-carboxyvinyltransferase
MGREASREIVRVLPGNPLSGNVFPPGDKSISHRALLLAALCPEPSRIQGLSTGQDVQMTANAITALGARVEHAKEGSSELIVSGGKEVLHECSDVLYLGNSGTSLRLISGMLAAFPWLSVLTGDASLRSRPFMGQLVSSLALMGARIEARGGTRAPVVLRGGSLTGIEWRSDPPSAQVKSALLLAGLMAKGPTRVTETRVTRRHTEELLIEMGVEVSSQTSSELANGQVVTIEPCTHLSPLDLKVPGDPSQAAFWVVAGCIVPGSRIQIRGLYQGPARLGFLEVLLRMGASVAPALLEEDHLDLGEALRLTPGEVDLHVEYSKLQGCLVEAREVPGLIDEVPILSVAAAHARGTTRFTGLGPLRSKESDRVASIARMINALGGSARELPDDELLVEGTNGLIGGEVDSQGDHRIAMAAAIAGLASREPVRIKGFGSVSTSYPGFLEDMKTLGGQALMEAD